MQPNQPSIPSQQPGQPAGQPAVPLQPQQTSQPQQKQQPLSPSTAPKNPNSTQNTLEIAAIRDGVVIMQDGSFRSVVMAKSINFDLMSINEQEAVEFAYQSFLNSLYFDIQIQVRSRKIDMRPYLERLGQIRTEMSNMLLGMLMEDYIYFIDDLVSQTNIMNKQFYVVVPFIPIVSAGGAVNAGKGLVGGLIGGKKQKSVIKIDEVNLEKAKTELTNRVQSVVSGLSNLGVQSIPLDTQELIELYYNAYNPDTATRQTLKQSDQMAVPVVTKGEGQAPKPNLGVGL
jgi:type IV secretory pathway VirB4 component